MHNEECNRQEQLEDMPVGIVGDKADVEHKLSAEGAENKLFAEVVHSKSYDFEVFEEDCEDQKSNFAKAGSVGRLGILGFYLLFRNTLSRFLGLDYADMTDHSL